MLIHKRGEDKLATDAKADLNRLMTAYNDGKLTWWEYLHQVSMSVDHALQSAREASV